MFPFRLVLWSVALLYIAGPVHARTPAYQPLGTWLDPTAKWQADLQARAANAAPPAKASDRPQLSGLRSRNVELLQDALLRKHPRLLGNSAAKSRLLLARRFIHSPAQLEGIMAEALFLNRNPEWGYVGKPNAPQHDVYRWQPGRRTPVTGQVKYHRDGNPATYAGDMTKDWRAERFFVPDDHVAPLRDFLEGQARRLTAAGDKRGAEAAWRNRARVTGLGLDQRTIARRTRSAFESTTLERYATYTSFGAAVALSLGPTAWDWANGNIHGHQALYRTTRTLSHLGVGIGTDLALANVAQGSLRGTVHGNVIVGTALAITEVTWLLYEHGWSKAFYQPVFYEEVFGGVSAIALGLTGASVATAMAAETGPWAPVIGTGVGIVTGTVGYIGGRSAAHTILDVLSPDMIQQREREQLRAVCAALDRSITDLARYP